MILWIFVKRWLKFGHNSPRYWNADILLKFILRSLLVSSEGKRDSQKLTRESCFVKTFLELKRLAVPRGNSEHIKLSFWITLEWFSLPTDGGAYVDQFHKNVCSVYIRYVLFQIIWNVYLIVGEYLLKICNDEWK